MLMEGSMGGIMGTKLMDDCMDPHLPFRKFCRTYEIILLKIFSSLPHLMVFLE
jgi:hypothetical protein